MPSDTDQIRIVRFDLPSDLRSASKPVNNPRLTIVCVPPSTHLLKRLKTLEPGSEVRAPWAVLVVLVATKKTETTGFPPWGRLGAANVVQAMG